MALYLNPNNLANDKITNGLQGDAGDQQRVSDRIGEKRTNESRVEHRA